MTDGGRDPIAGLALAGANHHRDARSAQNDGLLTVPEISALDLSRVDWVVLSACQTATGTIVPGQGVLGLSWGFRVAGARSLILSLWVVEDEPKGRSTELRIVVEECRQER